MEILDKNCNMGTTLELCCPRHPKTPLHVASPDDFSRVSPEAGCDLLCGQRLPCGHSCVNKCHSEGLHKAVYCTKSCNRVKKGCDHNCPYECGRPCDEYCNIRILGVAVELPCGHHATDLPCWQYQDPRQAKCRVLVERTVPACEHKVTLQCRLDVNDPSFRCTAICGVLRPHLQEKVLPMPSTSRSTNHQRTTWGVQATMRSRFHKLQTLLFCSVPRR
jgi:hypothetical protein